MTTFRLSTVACLLSLCIGSYPSAQSAEPPPAKHQKAESSSTKTGTTVIVGRWTGSFYGQNTGAYMSDDVFDFGPGSAG